jgi:hypothetical protein
MCGLDRALWCGPGPVVGVTYEAIAAELDPDGLRRHSDRGKKKDLTPHAEQRRGEPEGIRPSANNSHFAFKRLPQRRHSTCQTANE